MCRPPCDDLVGNIDRRRCGFRPGRDLLKIAWRLRRREGAGPCCPVNCTAASPERSSASLTKRGIGAALGLSGRPASRLASSASLCRSSWMCRGLGLFSYKYPTCRGLSEMQSGIRFAHISLWQGESSDSRGLSAASPRPIIGRAWLVLRTSSTG